MSEKIFACLLRLYPPCFRNKYAEDALQLYRDRFRDERGLLPKARLYFDLIADIVAGLPQAYRNSQTEIKAASLAAHSGEVPSFRLLDKEPLSPTLILLGSVLAFTVLFAFSFVMTHEIFSGQSSSFSGKESPIESVLRRLNQPISQDSIGASSDASAASAAGAPAGTRNPPSTSVPAIPSTPPPGTRSDAPHAVAVQQPSIVASVVRTPNPERSVPISGQPRLENAFSAMAQLFQTHDLVMFGEVHDSEQEYDWLCKLVKTPGFSDRVDEIVVEFGNARYQRTVDRYVAGEDVTFDEVQKAWRNMVADVEPVSPVYGRLYRAVREANLQRPGQRGIRLLMGSPSADWSKIKTSAELAPYEAERERWYAQVVKQDVLAKHHRALLIMGAGHFLRGHEQALEDELAAAQHRVAPPVNKANLGPGFIERQLRAAGANPYLVVFGTNMIDNRGDVDQRFNTWPAPVIVPLSGNWVGALPAQPVISGGRAQATSLTLADQADAMLYVAPCSALQTVYLSRAELDGTAYAREMIRRNIIELGHPVSFQYGNVPQCAQAAPSAH